MLKTKKQGLNKLIKTFIVVFLWGLPYSITAQEPEVCKSPFTNSLILGELDLNNSTRDINPLEYAIETQNLKQVTKLLKSGANIHEFLDMGQVADSPFELALFKYNTALGEKEKALAEQIVDVFLEKTDPKFKNEYGITELMRLARDGNTQQLKDLIHKGHNIHAKDSQGLTVADYAMANKDPKPLEFLYRQGVRITKSNLLKNDGFSIFKDYSKLKIEHVKILIEGGFKCQQKRKRFNPFNGSYKSLIYKGCCFSFKKRC